MQPAKLNKFYASFFNLPRFQLRKDLASFFKIIGYQKKILDIGSGSEKPYKGIFNGDIHVGIDLFEHSDVIGDIKVLPFKDNAVDLVLCTEVLEHVPEPPTVLREARRVLKRGQYLIVTTPLIWGEHDYIDFQRWTEAGLKKLLIGNGFKIIDIHRRGGLFSSIGCQLAHIPQEMFGTFSFQMNWFLKILYIAMIVVVLPLPWLFSIFDILDRKRNWIIGYSILCRAA